MGQAMIYIFALAFSAGCGLLVAAFMGYKLWGWYKTKAERKTSKMKRKGV
ncbi:hypothetical protein [Lysinibacillus sp. 54212]